ncbi:MAG: hypothetical protein Q7R49_02905 [Candidatus Daviesbacteria bacterium]|nr:hypothetical protein [Candidatus Daviesbacteria bacterium]
MQIEKKPNFLEIAAVKSLLFLENHLQKKPSPPVDWAGRRQLLKDIGTNSLLLGSATAVGLTIRTAWELYQAEQVAQKKDVYLKKVKAHEDYYGHSWQSSPEVQLAIDEAKKNPDLQVLGLNNLKVRLYSQNNLFFYQTSNIAVLAIDKKSLASLVDQTGKTERPIAFVLNDRENPKAEVSGAINVRSDIDKNWKTNIHGTTLAAVKKDLSVSLSSMIATVYESMQLFNSGLDNADWKAYGDRYKWYFDQFNEDRLTPIIQVLAVNPFWVDQRG